MSLTYKLIESWKNEKGNVNNTASLLEWISELNATTYVDIKECSINDGTLWFYDDYSGEVLNRKRSFFSIKGMRYFVNNQFIAEQPIIIQPEIGYLGIICKEIDGVLNFLMQAKVEPGNVNCVQISPTIQATKSNFTRAHGGKLPTYFEYFENSQRYNVVYDQIQSEQTARFYKKRNRNMIMLINEDIEVYPTFRWMTLGQIKHLMCINNLVNMDTRTVFSGIPLVLEKLQDSELASIEGMFSDKSIYRSIFETSPLNALPKIYQIINNYKMFQEVVVALAPLNQLVDWQVDEFGITCNKTADFMVRYYDIEISGREVRKWSQPLFKALGKATFGLILKEVDGVKKVLVKMQPDLGAFDKVELGPTVYWESSRNEFEDNQVDQVFRKAMKNGNGVKYDVILSEEGGRFFHEQNRNVIIEIDDQALSTVPDGYIWTDFGSLNYLVQVNNCLNIQLRNLISLMKI